MLTPVTPNPIATSTTIKSHGSETRTAPGHNPVEAQLVQPAASHVSAIGLDAGTILANVNAEAATAGNRTVLQTLALAVAAQLNMARRADETMDAFFLRIASALDDMVPDERQATEARAGLKLLKITLPELSAALKQPDSALAARLSAMAEAPLATPQKTAAAAATTTYLQEAPGFARAAETLAMVTQSRSNGDGKGFFSSASTSAPAARDNPPADARSLQTQLKSLFEPGIAETRQEIAERAEPAKVLILGVMGETAEAMPAAPLPEPQAQPVKDEAAAPTMTGAEPSDEPRATAVRAEAVPDEGQSRTAAEADAQPADARSAEARPLDTRQTDARLEARPADAKPTDTKPGVMPAEARATEGEAPAARPEEAKRAPVPAQAVRDVPFGRPAADAPAPPRAEPRMLGLPFSQGNLNSSMSLRIRAIAQELVPERTPAQPQAAERHDEEAPRMQTMLALKGIAEIASTVVPAKAAELAANPQLPAAERTEEEKKATAANPALPAADDAGADSDMAAATDDLVTASVARKDAADSRHASLPMLPTAEDAEEMPASRHAATTEQMAAARTPDQQAAAGALSRPATTLDPVPFAYAALQPAKDEFKAEAAGRKNRHEAEDGEAEDQGQEDPEARRERLARKAVDDLLRSEPEEEPDLKITRDSSRADRAYALYQRMAGF